MIWEVLQTAIIVAFIGCGIWGLIWGDTREIFKDRKLWKLMAVAAVAPIPLVLLFKDEVEAGMNWIAEPRNYVLVIVGMFATMPIAWLIDRWAQGPYGRTRDGQKITDEMIDGVIEKTVKDYNAEQMKEGWRR